MQKIKTKQNLVGQKFGMLTVIERADDVGDRVGWRCRCDCGNIVVVRDNNLKQGSTKSCGCLLGKWERGTVRLPNTYEFVDDYVIGHDPKGKEFYFDRHDYDLVSQYKWTIHQYGYARAKVWNNDGTWQFIYMHRLLMGFPEGMDIDHINHKRHDNRRANLRVVPHGVNMKNTTRSPSVIIKKYCVKDHEELGYFDNRKEAIKAYQEYISQ